MPLWMKAGWIFFVLIGFWILEGHYSQFGLHYKKWRHARTNFVLLFFVIIINAAFGILTLGVFEWLNASGFGLLPLIDAPVWLGLLLSLIVLDLIAQYFVHFLLHKIPFMWRLHLVHHTDKHVDVTTGTRHHPLDFIIREIFAILAVIIMGMPISFYFLYRLLSVLFTYFTHANLALPGRMDRWLSYLIVTPNMHKFHHHHKLPWTDSNYGNILSVWDRLFGTFVYGDLKDIKYGVDVADHRDDESFKAQLLIPFDATVGKKGKMPD
jgi:sterol desaturase/sphingolipid hydroxylase (fatty acid hydroxylase superfamily)